MKKRFVQLSLVGITAAALALSGGTAGAVLPSNDWTPTTSMLQAREGGGAGEGGLAALLPDGKVLVAGGFIAHGDVFAFDSANYLDESEIYDPATATWSVTGSMHDTRFGPALVTLNTGKVLVAGGFGGVRNRKILTRSSAELYSPATGRWQPAKAMSTCRFASTTSTLSDGRILVVGGADCSFQSSTSVEIFNPATERWTTAASLNVPRWGHSATTLSDGRILVAGGRASAVGAASETVNASSEIYDPSTDTWTLTANDMTAPRIFQAAGLLPDGRVIVAGGHCIGDPHCASATADVFTPSGATGTWAATAPMSQARAFPEGVTLSTGSFLVPGGVPPVSAEGLTAEKYDPVTNTWSSAGTLHDVRADLELVTLPSGDVLTMGGFNVSGDAYHDTATAEIYHP